MLVIGRWSIEWERERASGMDSILAALERADSQYQDVISWPLASFHWMVKMKMLLMLLLLLLMMMMMIEMDHTLTIK